MSMPQRKTAGGPAKGRARNVKRQAKLKAVQDVIEDAYPEETLIRRWAEQASTGIVLCRQFFRHDFSDDDLLRLFRINGTYSVREMTCRRCKTKRVDLVANETLQVVKRQYDYVTGYQREKSAGGSIALPRWAITDAMASRVDWLEPSREIKEVFGRLGRGYS